MTMPMPMTAPPARSLPADGEHNGVAQGDGDGDGEGYATEGAAPKPAEGHTATDRSTGSDNRD